MQHHKYRIHVARKLVQTCVPNASLEHSRPRIIRLSIVRNELLLCLSSLFARLLIITSVTKQTRIGPETIVRLKMRVKYLELIASCSSNKMGVMVTVAVVYILFMITATKRSEACNEAVCASVVSKCMLTQSCKCDMETCTCCKECFSCLSYLYDECCSCVDLCPKPNVTDNPLSKKSHVEDFNEPVPALFQALTAEEDPLQRWIPFTFPVDYDMTLFHSKEKDMTYHMQSNLDGELHALKPNIMTVNCTVAFMAQCISWNKCSASCQSMGATSYRWFHDGCCECIGDTCINYGVNESKCLNCPMKKEEDDDQKDQYDDYGQVADDLEDESV